MLEQLILLLVLGVVVLPLGVLFVGLSLRRRVIRLEERLDRLSGVLKSGAATLKSTTPSMPTEPPAPSLAPSPVQGVGFPEEEKRPIFPPASLAPMGYSMPPSDVDPPTAPVGATFPAADSFPPPLSDSNNRSVSPGRPAMDWENFTGAKLFSWIGGVALFLGAVFFAKYSMDHGWVSPALRVALGCALGAGAVLAGLSLRGRYDVSSQTLAGAGASILFADIFAAHALYGFLGPVETFAFLSLVTVMTFLLSVRLNSKYIALLALVGGFLIPPLVSTGVDRPLGLFGYITLLDLGLLAVVLKKEWGFLWGLAALGTVAMQWRWMDRFLTAEKLEVAAAHFIWFPILFALARERADRLGKKLTSLRQAAGAVPLVAVAFAVVTLPTPAYGPIPLPLFAVLLVANIATAWLGYRWPVGQGYHVGAGLVTFLGILAWTERFFNENTVALGLGTILAFGLLHGVLSVVLSRRAAPRNTVIWGQVFPLLMLIPLILALTKNTLGTPLVWAGLFAVNAVILLAAVLTGFLWGALGAVLLSFWAAGRWLRLLPGDGALGFLVVVGGLAALFFLAGEWLFRRRESGEGVEINATPESAPVGPAALPVASALLPFLLLAGAAEKWRPADPSALFALGGLLLLLLLSVARRGGPVLEWLTPVGLGSVVLLEWTWHGTAFTVERLFPVVVWYGAFSALFLSLPFVAPASFGRQRGAWWAAALSGPAHLWLFYKSAQSAGGADRMGLLPLVWALLYVAALAALLRRGPVTEERRTPVALVAGAALFFVSLIFPMQFEKQWITLGWALEGFALVSLYRRVPHSGLKAWGWGLLLVAFVRLALNPAVLDYHPREEIRVWNWYLYAYGITALCHFGAARRWRPSEERWMGTSPQAVLAALGVVLLFLLMNIEIADAFSSGSALAFTWRGPLAQDMAVTLGWGLFGLGLLIFGLWKNGPGARWAGLGLLGVTIGKLFLHDVWRLPLLYRAGAFVGLAAVLMVGSFLYQKYSRNLSPGEGR